MYTLLDDAQILNYDDKMNIIYFVWNGVNHCSLKREIKVFIYSTQFTPNYCFKANNIGMYTFGCMLSIYGIYTCVYAIASLHTRARVCAIMDYRALVAPYKTLFSYKICMMVFWFGFVLCQIQLYYRGFMSFIVF